MSLVENGIPREIFRTWSSIEKLEGCHWNIKGLEVSAGSCQGFCPRRFDVKPIDFENAKVKKRCEKSTSR